ncbi:surface polysaccharide O-acyltransferase-like enzyme [Halanaerobium saccharolyticum]|uniref:Surface polysaccharide O-acyltransferase-like enzyme n=1 Tax=Halanaerobium saccharolyticum TaxID=43595 RepID=A0A4R7YSA5_9FIRM|nr:acyltransferase [Halanaerobium saccharolyticum]RAK10241.1 surface polysaccharide O-acyltransferase-like enzyme [Halanaerobium saccharolyticum]TDW00453.1 surface polysaccharide O-acyltransferase-like enzyme [Halanaerobium saccharolyticum]TDX52038.1 surface polysaccharide O-acyltransferase-like enzyme [Halanaerobium saccharolyticum]
MHTIKSNYRDNYIDYLRLITIVAVVILHTVMTYSGIANWHYIEEQAMGDLSRLISALVVTFINGYSMGFLFLISAYYTAKSYAKKGKKEYITGRLYRLGLPVLLFVLFIYPLTMYLLYIAGEKKVPKDNFWLYLKEYITTGEFLDSSGPLWFAFALLIFSIIYAIMGKKREVSAKHLPNTSIIILTIILVGTGSYFVRLVFPIGFEFLNMPLSNFAQHIASFIIGIKAYQYGWFNQVRYKVAKRWLIGSIVIGIISWLALILMGGVIEHGDHIIKGKLNWQSYVYAVWESFICFGMSVGLIGFFRKKFNTKSRLLVILSKNSFSVYVWHTLVLVAVSLLMRDLVIYPLVKMMLVAVTTLSLCFFLSHYVFRALPILKKIM